MPASMRAVSVVEVRNEAVWAELDIDRHTRERLGPCRRVVAASFDGELEKLAQQGTPVLIRYARRERSEALVQALPGLPDEARTLLHAAQRHAVGNQLSGRAWIRANEQDSLRLLLSQGLMESVDSAFRLAPDLPPPPTVAYDFEESWMEATDDLSAADASPVGLLHDMASLAACLLDVPVRKTLKGELSRTDTKKLGTRMGCDFGPRQAGAMRALEALGVVATDGISREVYVDLDLEHTLAGTTSDALDRLVHRLIERDLHPALPAIRAALAGPAVDRMIFLELLEEQHRTVLFRAYPTLEGEEERPLDSDGWERLETRLIKKAIRRLERLGLVRRASGMFAPSADGAVWAGHERPLPPIWVSSDLEVTVPPEGVTPWERFQLERLGRCVSRDVVDRYRLTRLGLHRWLANHDVDEALELLRRRCPGVPGGVEDTLRVWAEAATRVVLTRGVLLSSPS